MTRVARGLERRTNYLGPLRLNNGCVLAHWETAVARPRCRSPSRGRRWAVERISAKWRMTPVARSCPAHRLMQRGPRPACSVCTWLLELLNAARRQPVPRAGRYLPPASVPREDRDRARPVHPRSGGDNVALKARLRRFRETDAGEWPLPPLACDCVRRASPWHCASGCGRSLHPAAARPRRL